MRVLFTIQSSILAEVLIDKNKKVYEKKIKHNSLALNQIESKEITDLQDIFN